MRFVISILLSLASTGAVAAGIEDSVSGSDDFQKYRKVFVRAANELVGKGLCTPAQLAAQGGFWKSQNHKSKPVYFTYCGGESSENRIYIDAGTGQVFR